MSERIWYDIQIIPKPEYNSKIDPSECPRCGAETIEELDEVYKTSGYHCPDCNLRTDR
jgi:DNA-directed RNA polymerase subunit RPC12/RpoP